ncbi:DedA family protein [Pannus brasiliensis CCIBt3594]|uniref:DedA family protein n=1 Tax=Pannus brasiliensis CCIBt3594 TaxID=1427578 RepID=A0AAW9R1F9_9CHRO
MSLELLSLENIQEIARQYGYWAVFIGIALENTGIPIPGETITIVGGFLAGSGELDYWLVLAVTIAGAVIGDNFGYWIGRAGGWPLLVKVGTFFRVPVNKIEEARDKFRKNAAQAVFFGRFVTLLRIFAGPMAGIARMPYPSFFLCNLGGATVWAAIIVSASYFLGRLFPLHEVVESIARFGLFALLVVGAWLVLAFAIDKIENRKTATR